MTTKKIDEQLLIRLSTDGSVGFDRKLYETLWQIEKEWGLISYAEQIIAEGWDTTHLNAEMVAAAIFAEAGTHELDIRRAVRDGKTCETPNGTPYAWRQCAADILKACGHITKTQVAKTDISPLPANLAPTPPALLPR